MPELAPLVDLGPDEFNRRFASSAVRRAGRDGFVRNVVVALGNSRSSEAVPPLARALTDPSALVRGHASWALGEIDCPEARALLEAARLMSIVSLKVRAREQSSIPRPASGFAIIIFACASWSSATPDTRRTSARLPSAWARGVTASRK